METRVIVENIGPFKSAEIELKPLTIFIGKNSVGKSLLIQLIWSLTYTTPDFKVLAETTINKGGPRIC